METQTARGTPTPSRLNPSSILIPRLRRCVIDNWRDLMAIDWSDIYSRTVKDGFSAALSDKRLTHAEVVDVLFAVLEDGELTGVEMNDLHKIARTSETIPTRSKLMLVTLGNEVLRYL